jgi:hypothetical protein
LMLVEVAILSVLGLAPLLAREQVAPEQHSLCFA